MGGRGSEDQPKAHGRAVTASAAGSVLQFRILLPFSTSLGRVSQHGAHQVSIPGARRRSDIRVLRLLIPGVGPVRLPGISLPEKVGRARRVTRSTAGNDSGEAARALRFALRRLEGRGRPLDAAVRRRLEPVLPFSTEWVRIHTGVAAAESARRLRARAFTIGSDVYFGAGQFRPQSARVDARSPARRARSGTAVYPGRRGSVGARGTGSGSSLPHAAHGAPARTPAGARGAVRLRLAAGAGEEHSRSLGLSRACCRSAGDTARLREDDRLHAGCGSGSGRRVPAAQARSASGARTRAAALPGVIVGHEKAVN